MHGFLVEQGAGPLYMVLRRGDDIPGIMVGDGPNAAFLPFAKEYMNCIPEECWNFGLGRVYVQPLTFARQSDGKVLIVPEPLDSKTYNDALVLLSLSLAGCHLTRFELDSEQIVARATAIGDGRSVEQMLVVLRPGQSVKAVGYQHGTLVASQLLTFDGRRIIFGPVLDPSRTPKMKTSKPAGPPDRPK
jgi:hypothetical protein